VLTIIGRMIILDRARNQVTKGRSSSIPYWWEAMRSPPVSTRFQGWLRSSGYHYTGYVSNPDQVDNASPKSSPVGNVTNIEQTIDRYDIQLVVVAMERSARKQVEISSKNSATRTSRSNHSSTLDILSGSVRTNDVMGAILSDIHTGLMPEWQQNIKRVFDVLISAFGLILLSPFMLYAAIRTRLSSKDLSCTNRKG